MNRVIPTDRKRVAVAGGAPDFQLRGNRLDARGHCRRAAVNRVKTKGIHIIREAAGAADPGNDDEVFALDAQLRKNGLHSGEDRVVSAAGAPAYFLVGLKIFFRQRRGLRRRAHPRSSSRTNIPSIFCSISPSLTGRPLVVLMPPAAPVNL